MFIIITYWKTNRHLISASAKDASTTVYNKFSHFFYNKDLKSVLKKLHTQLLKHSFEHYTVCSWA